MRFTTHEEWVDIFRPVELNGSILFGLTPDDEDVVRYLKNGIYPGPIRLDKRFKHNTPPLEKQYPILKNILTDKELSTMNNEYYSLVNTGK
jgi:hypothetical protein